MQFLALITHLRIQDVVDILFLTIVAYHLYLWFQDTKALKALVGLLALGAIYTVAQTWGLFLTTWVFQILWQVLVILLIILFQSEIRQVLERVNPLRAIGLLKTSKPEEWIPNFSKGTFILSKNKIGALMIIERRDRVEELVTEGQPLEGEAGPELLLSIFQKESPLHDGALLIKDGLIKQVACYLPLSPDEDLPKTWGTRHRAALGLSQRCDAWVVVVSEERGEVSLARGGEMMRLETEETLTDIILQAIQPFTPQTKNWKDRVSFLLTNRWKTKLLTIASVSLVWLMVAGQQNFEKTFQIPVFVKSLPADLEILEPKSPKIKLTVRGLRKDASMLDERNVRVELDLSHANVGRAVFAITRQELSLRNPQVQIIKMEPPKLMFQFKRKEASEKVKEGP